MISVFCVASTQKKLLAHMTLAVAGVPISMCDKMPQVICDKCLGNLDIAYACWRRCRESWGDYVRDPALQDKEVDYRCRICLRSNVDELISLFCICDSQLLKINEMIKQYSGVEVKEDDGHPQYTCDGCLSELNVGFQFRKLCRQSNVKLRCELQAKETVIRPSNASDNESLPEDDRNNQTPEPPPKESLKKIAKRRQSVKMRAKPELPAGTIRITKLDIPEVVPGSIKKQKVFSSPSEFKQLTNQILNKSKELTPVKTLPSGKKTSSSPSEIKPLADKVKSNSNSSPSALLVAFELRVLTDSEQYTHSEISSFKCSQCNSRNPLNTIDVTCVKCASPFDNYLLVRPYKGNPRMAAYCCTECNYFSKSLTTMVNHLDQHVPVVPTDKSKPMVMKNLVVPIVPIAMKEETVEAPSADDDETVPDPLETVFVEGTLKRVCKTEPEGQVKKPRKESTADTMDVLIELNQSEPESVSDVDSSRPSSRIGHKIDQLFDTILEADFFKILLLKGVLCCGCLKLFPFQDDLRQHRVRDHTRKARFDGNEITCATCTERCQSVRDHQLLATKKIFYFCKACPQLLIVEQDFESHRTKHHPSLTVRTLPKSDDLLVTKAVSSKKLTTPLKLTSGDPTLFKPLKETAQYRVLLLQGEVCCRCYLVHPTPELLGKHVAEAHPPTQAASARNKCGRCNGNHRSEAKLTQHRLQGLRRLYYACKLCRGRLLDGVEDFEAHRSKFHSRLESMANGPPLAPARLLVEKGN